MELTHKMPVYLVVALAVGCSGSVSSNGGSSGQGGGHAGGGDGGNTQHGGGSGGTDTPDAGGTGGSDLNWNHKCRCKNWTDPSNYPTDIVNGCAAYDPCPQGKVCCAISCVAPYPRVCDWYDLYGSNLCLELEKENAAGTLCCHVYPGVMTLCVDKDSCAPEGVLEHREPAKPGDKYYPMCLPPKP